MDFDKPKVYGDTSITDGLVYLKASVKDSVDNDKGEEGDKPGNEGKKDHQDERVHLFLRLRSLGLVPNAPSSS